MNPEVTRRIALISAREVVASKYLRSSALSAVPSQNARAKKSSQVATILAYNSTDFTDTKNQKTKNLPSSSLYPYPSV
jgi:hypothetical protein